MKKIFSACTNPKHILQPLLFGILIAVVFAVDGMPQARQLSPFAGTAVALTFGAFTCLLAHIKILWSAGNPGKDALVRSLIAGSLLCLGVFFMLLGFSLQAHLLSAAVCLTLMPMIALLGRKLFWGEALAPGQRLGIMISFSCAGVWLMIDQSTGSWGQPLLPASGTVFFAGNASVFGGALLLGLATSVGRPADYRIPASAYWSWVGIAAALISVPVMAVANQIVQGNLSQAALLKGLSFQKGLVQMLPSLLLGTSLLCFRVVYLARSSLILTASTTGFLWTISALSTSVFLAFTLLQSISLLHLVTLPLHAVGLLLARRTLTSIPQYMGLAEASPERRVA